MPTYGCRKNRRSSKGSSNHERVCCPPSCHRRPHRARTPLALFRPLRCPRARPSPRPQLVRRRHPGGQRPRHEPRRPRLRRLAPRGPAAWQRNIVWEIRVQPDEGDPWVQEFGLQTPSEAVAGFLAALVTRSAH
ncbi:MULTISPECIES: DUF317 domain-containing protein [unclassified Streptomyces]|uniref:DUF317 domain-containing protein n=1 Tax=unclassified Streptomyces TaxID=2593676 RepID=UPI001F5469A2|nr:MULTISPECIES: DUF317 domain-containing protein [unclassified Streptomyces]